MARIKISSKVDEDAWLDLKLLASEERQDVSDLLIEAIKECVQCRRIRPIALDQLEKSMDKNDLLAELLAR